MSRRNRLWTFLIIGLTLVVVYLVLPSTSQIKIDPLGINRDIHPRLGLDLSGGSQVLLEATDCNATSIGDRLENARQIIEKRVNSLGVSEPLVQIQGTCRILVELPSIDDPAQALALIQQTGRLEFVDAGTTTPPPADGSTIRTTGNPTPTLASTGTPISATLPNTATLSGEGTLTSTITPSETQPLTSTEIATGTTPPTGTGTLPLTLTQTTIPDKVYNTILTGADLDANSLRVGLGGTARNEPEVTFSLVGQAAQTFAQFTTAHNEGTTGGLPYYMCIVLDNQIVS